MKDIGNVSYLLGMQISRNSTSISISQSRMTTELLERSERIWGKQIKQLSPSKPGEILSKFDGVSLNKTESELYRSTIGSLLYLACSTRPDIAYSVSILCQFVSNPKDIHLKATKQVLGYLKGTVNYGLVYRNSSGKHITIYSDSDYAGCVDTSRSRSAAVVYSGDNLISWILNKHPEIDESTCAAEYIGMHHAGKEGIWLNKLLEELNTGRPNHDQMITPPVLKGDNQSALKILSNGTTGPMGMKRHIKVHYRWTEEMIENGRIKAEFVKSSENLADNFTKPVPASKFREMREHFVKEISSSSGSGPLEL
jgi:hypothetical protein